MTSGGQRSERLLGNTQAELLEIVRGLVEEVNPRTAGRVGLGSLLDRELGLDSLALVELLVRVEDAFGVNLPDETLGEVRTPDDLLRLVRGGSPPPSAPPPAARARPAPKESGELHDPPHQAKNLSEVLEWHAARRPDRVHIRLLGSSGAVEELTYGSLREAARLVSNGLVENGAVQGERIALMLPTGREYFEAFVGVLLAGAVPVPLYPPTRRSQVEDHLLRQARILENAEARDLITDPDARMVAGQLRLRVPNLRRVLTARDVSPNGPEPAGAGASESDIALLQYTSGSTGQPKGVVLTHGNLLANLRAMGEVIGIRPDRDVFISWLPLYHDMGLIGAWLGSLYYGMELVLMPPTSFLHRPARWLHAIHEYRGTISASPNFGFELCLNRIDDQEMEGLDLGSWRIALNGAEPVSPDTVTAFAERFGRWGFSPNAMTPVYGLAEASLGLTFPPIGRGPVIDRIAREPFLSSGLARPASETDPTPLRFVSCGTPLPGHEVRVVDEEAEDVHAERQQGRIEFRGPSATSGYFRNPQETARLIAGAWVDSGDLGYLAGGELFVTGRRKDVVIRAGRNIHPQELEQAVGAIEGVRKGRVAIFGAGGPAAGTERLVVLAETRERDEQARGRITEAILAAAVDLLGMPPDDIVLAPPGTILKTSSGKVRRAASRELYESGRIDAGPRPFWRQLVSLTASGGVLGLRRFRGSALTILYCAYTWAAFLLVAPALWLLICVTPGLRLRWAVFRAGARLLLLLAGIRLRVEGPKTLADGPLVIAANHASVLDGLVLSAVLSRRLVFVAAAELRRHSIAAIFLQRLGMEFVDRDDRRRAAAAFDRLEDRARRGSALVFFPEGRMGRVPGLQPFRLGAFVVAANAGAPILPIAISGTGSILRGDERVPRMGRVKVVVGEAMTADQPGWPGAVRLRNEVRVFISRHAGEPDLDV